MLMLAWGNLLLIAAACGACVASRGDDTTETLCGNGVVDVGETCDEGIITGTYASSCTVSCTSRVGVWHPIEADTTRLPFAPTKMFPWTEHLIITRFDDNGIVLVPYQNRSSNIVLRVRSRPRGFDIGTWDSLGTTFLWVEEAIPGVGGPWLFYITLSAPEEIHELPYPDENSVAGSVVEAREGGSFGFTDMRSDITLSQTRLSSIEGSTPVFTTTELGVAPSGSIGKVVQIQGPSDAISPVLVQVFNGNTANAHLGVIDDPAPSTGRRPSLERVLDWPKPIVDVAWLDNWNIGVLDNDGTIDRVNVKDPPEIPSMVFGQSPSSLTGIKCLRDGIIGVDHQGNVIAFWDNGQGKSLQPQVFAVGFACSTCTIGDSAIPEWFAFDEVAIHGFVSRQ